MFIIYLYAMFFIPLIMLPELSRRRDVISGSFIRTGSVMTVLHDVFSFRVHLHSNLLKSHALSFPPK